MTEVGLRIDVDTLRGTRDGVPALCDLLRRYSIGASFFFSVGPDNMGRHLWRLWRPTFLLKMLRSNAPGLYGWDILLRGACWPGPVIGEQLGPVIRSALDAGHEAGFHAWDHHAWQASLERMDGAAIRKVMQSGVQLMQRINGCTPTCSAAPAWKTNDLALLEKESFPFQYSSDCRGESIFYPVVAGAVLSQPQVPTTLPTYDEVIGRNGISDNNYNDFILSLIKPGGLNVLTIHAEVEGISRIKLFEDFLRKTSKKGIILVSLGQLLEGASSIGQGGIGKGEVPGRQGWVACQVNCTGVPPPALPLTVGHT